MSLDPRQRWTAVIIQQAVRALKAAVPEMIPITDVCLCEYTSHGHCGIVENGIILNDKTTDRLADMARSHARSGTDMVAPSDMMDGTVASIRMALDTAGFESLPIMAYAAKFASALYAPFREAAQSSPEFGDRKSHQLNSANRRDAMRSLERCAEDGADILMVKPALPYLDILNCGIISGLNLCSWLKLGYQARYVQLGDHTVSQVSWDAGKTWHLFDSSMSFFCYNHKRQIASCQKIKEAHGCELSDGKVEPGQYYF